MKGLFALALLLTVSVSHADPKALSATTGIVATSYVSPVAGTLVSSAISVQIMIELDQVNKEEVAKAALSDAQEYAISGKLSIPLFNSVRGLQEQNPELSEQDAIDMIVEAMEPFLK